MRWILVAAPLVALAGCHDWDHDGRDDFELTVRNSGTAAAHVHIDDGSQDLDFDVVAGGSANLEFSHPGIDVEVRRSSDGALLYESTLDWEDFDDEDGHVTITVYP